MTRFLIEPELAEAVRPELTEASEQNSQVSARACAFKSPPSPHLSAFAQLCSRCQARWPLRARQDSAWDERPQQPQRGARCAALARARARARTRWSTATSPSTSPTARACSSAPTVRAFPSPDTRPPPVHPATTPASCTDPHARATLFRRLPPMLTGAHTSIGTMAVLYSLSVEAR